MNFDELLERPAISALPLTLAIPLPDPSQLGKVLARAARLLADRPAADEILVATPIREGDSRPAILARRHVRYVPSQNPTGGRALSAIARVARGPAVLVTDPEVSIESKQLGDVLDRLNSADVVLGIRTPGRSSSWLVDFLLRRIFAVPLADPLCPIRAFRKAAVDGIPLESTGPLVGFELAAKLTFLTSLMDEAPVGAAIAGERSVLAAVREDPAGFRKLLLHPRFWDYEPHRRPARPPLNRFPDTGSDHRDPTPPSRPTSGLPLPYQPGVRPPNSIRSIWRRSSG